MLGEGVADGDAEEGDVEGDADVEGAVDVALADGAELAVADGPGAAPPWHDAPLMVQSEGCPASPVDVVTKPTETDAARRDGGVPAVAGHRHLASVVGVGTVPQGGDRRADR